MANRLVLQARNALAARLTTHHGASRSWRKTGATFGMSGGLALRIARQGYTPRNADVRKRLGLVGYRDLWDWPVGELAKAIRERTAK